MKLPSYLTAHKGTPANRPPVLEFNWFNNGASAFRLVTQEEMKRIVRSPRKHRLRDVHYWGANSTGGAYWDNEDIRHGHIDVSLWYITASAMPKEEWSKVVNSQIKGK